MQNTNKHIDRKLEYYNTQTSATRNSLVVLDELGRGTATSDGQAIAYVLSLLRILLLGFTVIVQFIYNILTIYRESVLEHFIDKVQCRGLFSTHYHRLSVDYQTNPKVL